MAAPSTGGKVIVVSTSSSTAAVIIRSNEQGGLGGPPPRGWSSTDTDAIRAVDATDAHAPAETVSKLHHGRDSASSMDSMSSAGSFLSMSAHVVPEAVPAATVPGPSAGVGGKAVPNTGLLGLWAAGPDFETAAATSRLDDLALDDAGPARPVGPGRSSSKRKRGVSWGTETRIMFPRIQSFGTIPKEGLGLAMSHAPLCGTTHCKGCTGCQAILAEPSGGTGRVYPQHAASGKNLERVAADRRRALLTENEVDIDAEEVVQTARLSSLQERHEGLFCGCKGGSCEQNGDNCSCGASNVPCWYEPGRGGCGCKCLKTKCRNPAGLYRYNARTVNKARIRTLEECNDAPVE